MARDREGATPGVFEALQRPMQQDGELPLEQILAKRGTRYIGVADEGLAFEVSNDQIHDASSVLESIMRPKG